MSSEDICSWAASKTFRFLVGPEKREFVIHSELIAAQSSAFHAMVNNGMKESLEGVASLPECDAEAFARFLEFAYTGDFRFPLAARLGSDETLFQPGNRVYIPFPFSICCGAYRAWGDFLASPDLQYSGPILYDVLRDVGDNGDQALVAVARVYLLADYYGVDKLVALCRYKLNRLMVRKFENPYLLGLINLCLVESSPEPLRKVVLKYCAFNLKCLISENDFKGLVKKHPELLLEITEEYMRLMELYCDEDEY